MKIAIITKEPLKIKISNHTLDVFLWGELDTLVNLRDYDGLVVDLEGVDKASIEAGAFESVIKPKVIKDILVSRDNFVVLTGNPFIKLQRPNTNATQLLDHFGFSVSELPGKGDSFALTQYGETGIYAQYLSRMKNYEYSVSGTPQPSKSFLNIYKSIPGKFTTAITVMARNRSGYALGAIAMRNKYHPSDFREDFLHEGEFVILPTINASRLQRITMIIEANLAEEIATAPDWLEEMNVVGQSTQDAIVLKQNELLKQTQQKIADAEVARDVLRRILNLLFYKGKSLEKEVIFSLEDLGINVTKPEVDNELEFLFDYEDKNFVCEVKCVDKEHISKKALRQVTEWQDIAEEQTQITHKPVVFVSNDLDKPYIERTPNPLPDNLKTFAEKYEVAVLTVSTLYQVHQLVKKKQLTASKVIAKIHESSGLMSVEDFTS